MYVYVYTEATLNAMNKQLSLFSFVSTRSRSDDNSEDEDQTSHEPEPEQATASTVTATADDIALTSVSSLSRPINVTFPKRGYTDKERSFNPLWYNQYPWLEYSVKKDAAFCFPCRLFISGRRREKAFTVNGFRDWKHATGNKGGLLSHQNCLSHSQSVVAWEQFTKATSSSGTVVEQLGNNRSEMIKKNRHYIQAVSDVLRKQDIAIRGHRETDESVNRGNFNRISDTYLQV